MGICKVFDLFKPFIPQNLLKKIQIVTDRKTALNCGMKRKCRRIFVVLWKMNKTMFSLLLFVMNVPAKCGPGRTYWNGEFEKSGWKSRCNIR